MPAYLSRFFAATWRLAPLCAAVCGCAVAEAGEPAVLELAPLIISGGAAPAPGTMVTDPKRPRQPVPAADGADYLKTIPGFNLIRNGGANGDPLFRGLFGSRLNILGDGGVLLGACPGRMDAPTAYLAPENFDRLTVVKGPQTVLWGPGASAATILFERDTGRFNQLGGRVDGSLLVGSSGRFDRRLDATAGGDQGYLRLLANKAQADDYADGDGNSVPSRWRKWNSDVLLGWTPDDDSLVELSAGRGDGEARYAGRSMDGSQFLRESLGLRFDKDNLGDVFAGVQGQVYYNYADHVMDNFSLRTPSGLGMMGQPMASNVDRRTLGGRLLGTWQWSRVKLEAGLDGQRNEHRKRVSRYSMATGFIDAEQFARDKDAQFHALGLFGELNWRLAEAGRLIGGARLDWAQTEDLRQSVGTGMSLAANPTAGETRRDTLPSGFLRYERDLRELPATVYAGLGHVQRFPDYWELFSASRGPDGALNAFAGIRPEQTTQLDAGLQYRGARLEAWASGYVGRIRDYILFDYSSGQSQARNVEARIAGAELGASYRLDRRWKADASLAYAWGRNDSDGRPLAQMPPLEARLGLAYQGHDWSAGGLWRVVAAQNRIDLHKGNVVAQDLDNSSGFAVLSLNAAYRLSPQVRLSGGIDNLFDRRYSEHLNRAGDAGFGFPADEPLSEPGRTLWSKLDFSF